MYVREIIPLFWGIFQDTDKNDFVTPAGKWEIPWINRSFPLKNSRYER